MKLEKNKIVFGSVIAIVLIFLISYSIMIMRDHSEENKNLKETLVPELEQEQADYSSKLNAINDLKEVRETNAPSIYNEALIDSMGFYDPDLIEKEKQRIVDSIYRFGKINYTENQYRNSNSNLAITKTLRIDSTVLKIEKKIDTKEIGLEHNLFFASTPKNNPDYDYFKTDSTIYVTVDGNQTVSTNYRLRMRLVKDALINNSIVPKNTPVYGFISFHPNRAMIEIENILHQAVKLKAYDLQDGSEGIYVENSFRADAKREVVGDVVNDINISGVPQISGIKKIFQRNNRDIKVLVVNNYELILKTSLK
ncbi:conjugative transposon protein TraM [Algibacter miyuki]|uniref:Conjugative transposon protein TraM n=1 Tax=Algibacter miyuki TaxID=1306933 RepID=A0ABV5H0W5_9FLAO|nr:conjugative transposon protein TraM [Algibacter miyuki]MDN3664072.1 conjugative transposon protein TraM [Algibacter miyuki]